MRSTTRLMIANAAATTIAAIALGAANSIIADSSYVDIFNVIIKKINKDPV